MAFPKRRSSKSGRPSTIGRRKSILFCSFFWKIVPPHPKRRRQKEAEQAGK